VPRPRLAIAAVGLVALSGCGPNEHNTDVPGFVRSGQTPTEQAILRSIATYRTTKDTALACSLVTPHFLSGRFGGKVDNCQQVQREASRHLPDSADVQSVSGDSAKVLIDEPTATRSIYRMRRLGGTWKIDDIVEP
jgi:hypothetical protein